MIDMDEKIEMGKCFKILINKVRYMYFCWRVNNLIIYKLVGGM